MRVCNLTVYALVNKDSHSTLLRHLVCKRRRRLSCHGRALADDGHARPTEHGKKVHRGWHPRYVRRHRTKIIGVEILLTEFTAASRAGHCG